MNGNKSQKIKPISKNIAVAKSDNDPKNKVIDLIKNPLILIKIFTIKFVKKFESPPPYSSLDKRFQGEKRVPNKRLIEKKFETNQSKFIETLL